MITTRNRAKELRRTLAVLQRLNPPPAEILITADGCTDATESCVQEMLPTARFFVHEVGQGSVASRHQMLCAANSDLVLSLDDDSHPEQRDCVAQLLELFRERPGTAVAHFPQRTDEYPESLARTDFGKARLTGSFANSGACFRRGTYLKLPGFCGRFFHAYEEPDYALQCVAAGYDILFSPRLTIRHHYSPQARSEFRVHQHHARNEFWSAWLRCPFPYVFAVSLYRVASQAGYAARRGFPWLIREPLWWWVAVRGLPECVAERRPYPWRQYREWLYLLRRPRPVT